MSTLPNETNESYFRRRKEEFRAAQEALFSEYFDIVGPRRCPIHGENEEMCDHDRWDMEQDTNSVLNGWFTAVHYLVMDKGFDADKDVDFIDYTAKRGQGQYATLGMMECLKNGTWGV